MKPEATRKKPGPPKAFDLDAALRAAVMVFWEKGFDGASLSDLTRAMGINRPSLYGTFKDKQTLYIRALDWFDEQGELLFNRSAEEKTARRFVDRLLHRIADLYSTPDFAPGCFLIQSAMSTSSLSKFARGESAKRRLRNEMALRNHLKRFARKELPTDLTIETLAAYVTAIGNALAIRAADGAKRRDLYRIVKISMAFWPESAGANRD